MKIISVVGTRPNFMKIAPLIPALSRKRIRHVLIHTGQHYDQKMSELFFTQLRLPKPDINLGVGSGTPLEQMNAVIMGLDPILRKEKPDAVIVVGDVTSTFAATICAKRLGIPVAHVEAGLRSFDWGMPEEANRVMTDHLSDFLFTTEESANRNLSLEGIPKNKIFFVGNVMIDTLLSHRKEASRSRVLADLGIKNKPYCVLTLHRPSNVDDRKSLLKMLSIISVIEQETPVVFPLHPRTRKNLSRFGLEKKLKGMKNLILTGPLGYLDFLCLMDNASLALTDSGGIQEETTVLGTPCITLRDNTERPITLTKGTNLLVSTDRDKVIHAARKTLTNTGRTSTRKPRTPPLWDGKAADRIASILYRTLK